MLFEPYCTANENPLFPPLKKKKNNKVIKMQLGLCPGKAQKRQAAVLFLC